MFKYSDLYKQRSIVQYTRFEANGSFRVEVLEMIDKILNFIKKFLSTSISDGCKFEYDLYINKINIVKAKITAITFIVLEVMMIVTHYITNKDKLFDVPYIYYGSMYITILLAMIAFLVIFTRLGTDVPQNIAGIRYAGVFFISFILMWCAGISLLDQLTSGQVIVYIVAIIATAITPLISPVALLLIYLLIHTLFLILMQYFQESAELLFMNSINTSTFVIMSWAISYMRYKKLIEEFNTSRSFALLSF